MKNHETLTQGSAVTHPLTVRTQRLHEDFTFLSQSYTTNRQVYETNVHEYKQKSAFFHAHLNILWKKRELTRSYQQVEQQQEPFGEYYRFPLFFGERILNEMVDTTLGNVAEGRQQVLLLTGLPGVGKSTLAQKILHVARDRIGYSTIGYPTAERALAEAMHSVGSDHKSGTYTSQDYELGSAVLQNHIESALDRKRLVIIEAPMTSGTFLAGREERVGMDRGTSAIFNLFGPDGPYKESLVGVVGLVPSVEFHSRRMGRLLVDMGITKKRGPGGIFDGTVAADIYTSKELLEKYYDMTVADAMGIPVGIVQEYHALRGPIVGKLMEWSFREYFRFRPEQVFMGMSLPLRREYEAFQRMLTG